MPLLHKDDDIVEILRDRSFISMFLVETWHDGDSVCIRRLRQLGYNVADRPRNRGSTNAMSTNHGGVAVVSVPFVHHKIIQIDLEIKTLEFICVRLSCGSFSAVVLLIYRTGPISSSFFNELSRIICSLATFSDPFIVVGDLNIHLERHDNPHTREFFDLMSSHGLFSRINCPTHNLGGSLEVLFT